MVDRRGRGARHPSAWVGAAAFAAPRQVWTVLPHRLRPGDPRFDLETATVDELQRAAAAALFEDSQRREAKAVGR